MTLWRAPAHFFRQAGGNKAVAARSLGLSRRAFYRRLEQFGLGDLIAREEVN